MSADSQVWYVKISDGTVHPATLEQIDSAFNAGQIDENTRVLAAGEQQWKRLGELAGLDAAPSETPPSVTVSVAPSPPYTVRPLTLDLDDDEAALRPKSRKKMVVGTLAGVLVIGGIVGAVGRYGGDASPAVAAAAPSPPTPAASAADPVVPAPAASSAAPGEPRFSEEQKARLLAADKEREEQAKSRRTVHQDSVHGSRSYKSQGFSTGGSKYDPLNANF